ncbi:MAG: TrmH family RNA methyltransferase [Candidatus Saccharimonadales bacterium]
MREIILIAHNVRSAHNVGSLLRTAEGLGALKVYLTGYTPYPMHNGDVRLPHLAQKIHKQIKKTALDAEEFVSWEHRSEVTELFTELRANGFTIAAVEQHSGSTALPDYALPAKLALLVGREVEGIEPEILDLVDICLEIPMFGRKESFNVVQAAAMALYYARFTK